MRSNVSMRSIGSAAAYVTRVSSSPSDAYGKRLAGGVCWCSVGRVAKAQAALVGVA